MKPIIITPVADGLEFINSPHSIHQTSGFRAQVSDADGRKLSIYSRELSEANGEPRAEFLRYPYDRFVRADRTRFSNAHEVVDYINEYGSADRPTLLESKGGYEFTGAFSARVNESGQTGANDFGTFVGYTQSMVDSDQWLRFGFNTTAQAANDQAYWNDPDPNTVPGFDQTKGLFGGMHMPAGVSSMFDFSFDESPGYSAGVLGEDLNYTAATGSFDFTDAQVGDLALIRFDFNVIPQVANTTIEVGMIWQTRLADGTPTFAFPLTGTPVFYGTGTVGKTFLNRPILSAYFASNEDVNARALLAVKADNPIQVAPLTTLATLQR
jgi:hypothetical protein